MGWRGRWAGRHGSAFCLGDPHKLRRLWAGPGGAGCVVRDVVQDRGLDTGTGQPRAGGTVLGRKLSGLKAGLGGGNGRELSGTVIARSCVVTGTQQVLTQQLSGE